MGRIGFRKQSHLEAFQENVITAAIYVNILKLLHLAHRMYLCFADYQNNQRLGCFLRSISLYSPLAYVNHPKLSSLLKVITEVRPVYDLVYTILCAGNFTQTKTRVCIFEFPRGI